MATPPVPRGMCAALTNDEWERERKELGGASLTLYQAESQKFFDLFCQCRANRCSAVEYDEEYDKLVLPLMMSDDEGEWRRARVLFYVKTQYTKDVKSFGSNAEGRERALALAYVGVPAVEARTKYWRLAMLQQQWSLLKQMIAATTPTLPTRRAGAERAHDERQEVHRSPRRSARNKGRGGKQQRGNKEHAADSKA